LEFQSLRKGLAVVAMLGGGFDPLSARPAKNARLGVRPGAAKPQRDKKQAVADDAHVPACRLIREGRQAGVVSQFEIRPR